jgi:polygalacturonase
VAAAAQDRQTVVEPRFPPACAVLEARLDAPGGVLSEESERRPDTERLQEAIDRCPAGQAVKLTRGGDRGAFLAGTDGWNPTVRSGEANPYW